MANLIHLIGTPQVISDSMREVRTVKKGEPILFMDDFKGFERRLHAPLLIIYAGQEGIVAEDAKHNGHGFVLADAAGILGFPGEYVRDNDNAQVSLNGRVLEIPLGLIGVLSRAEKPRIEVVKTAIDSSYNFPNYPVFKTFAGEEQVQRGLSEFFDIKEPHAQVYFHVNTRTRALRE